MPDQKGEAHFRFLAKHLHSKEYISPEITAKADEEKDFEGDIFYSPTQGDYLLLPTEDDRQLFAENLAKIMKHSDALRTLAAIADAKTRAEEAEKVSQEIGELFEGSNPGESEVFEELIHVRRSKAWGTKKGWIYITPHLRKNATVKGHFRKEKDATLKKAVEKMLRRHGGSEKPEIFGGKFTHSFFKTEPKAGAWPLAWHYPSDGDNDKKNKDPENPHFHFSSEAAICRYLVGFEGIDTTFDPKHKKIEIGASGHASYAVFEGALSGSWSIPDQNGFDVLKYFRTEKEGKFSVDPKRECRLRITVETKAEAFVGVRASAAVKFPSIDLSGGKKGQKAEVGAGGEVFGGAQAGGGLCVMAKWSPMKAIPWLDLCKGGGKVLGLAGAGAEAKLSFSYKNGKFYYHHELGASLGLGLKNALEWELDFAEAFDFMGHIANSFEFHRILGMDDAAFDAYSRYSFALITEGKVKAKEIAHLAIKDAQIFGDWVKKASGQINSIKDHIFEFTSQRSMLVKCSDQALAQAILTIMKEYNVNDFRTLRFLLNSADNAHKFKWIIRRIADPNRPINKLNAITEQEKGNLLKAGIQIIRDFPPEKILKEKISGTDMKTKGEFLHDFEKLLHEKRIIP